jgi:starvation-inducible DNA-binding protein
MKTALTVAAVLIAISGVIVLLQGSVLAGTALIVVACIVGPGGYSIMGRK